MPMVYTQLIIIHCIYKLNIGSTMGLPSSSALHILEVSCDILRACRRCEPCVLKGKGDNHGNVEYVYIHSRVTVLSHVTFTYTCASNERFVWCSQIERLGMSFWACTATYQHGWINLHGVSDQ